MKHFPRSARHIITLLLLTLAMASSMHADDALTVTYRVTGLFSPDREEDLKQTLESLPGIELTSLNYPFAEATFRFDPAVAFKGVKPDDMVKRFDEKIRQASSSTFGIQPRFPLAPDQLVHVEIPVVGLDCKACALAAYECVAKLDGVAQATASFKEGKVTALIDPAKSSKAALEDALKKKQVKLAE